MHDKWSLLRCEMVGMEAEAEWTLRYGTTLHETSVTRHDIGQGSDLYAYVSAGLEGISLRHFQILSRVPATGAQENWPEASPAAFGNPIATGSTVAPGPVSPDLTLDFTHILTLLCIHAPLSDLTNF